MGQLIALVFLLSWAYVSWHLRTMLTESDIPHRVLWILALSSAGLLLNMGIAILLLAVFILLRIIIGV